TGPVVAVPRTTIVLASGCQASLVESMDLLTTADFEREVRGHHRVLLADPEISVLAVVEAGGLAVLHVAVIADRRKCLAVEGFGLSVVTDVQACVGNHDFHPERTAAGSFALQL